MIVSVSRHFCTAIFERLGELELSRAHTQHAVHDIAIAVDLGAVNGLVHTASISLMIPQPLPQLSWSMHSPEEVEQGQKVTNI